MLSNWQVLNKVIIVIFKSKNWKGMMRPTNTSKVDASKIM